MSLTWFFIPLALAAFMLPGWQIARRLGAAVPALPGFLISAVVWFHLVLAGNALGIRLDRTHLLAAWGIICLVACLWAWRGPPPVKRADSPGDILPTGIHWLWIVPAFFGLVSIGIRCVLEPLYGWDNSFRWDGLAQAILRHGNLDFYPATTAAHFEIYAWCDGIPPLASLLNLWIYLVADSTDAVLIGGRVLGEAVLIGTAVFSLGRSLWGREGGWPAVGMLGTSALFLWGVGMSQETGLTTLTLVALVYFLHEYQRKPAPLTACWAGLAAATGALSREYGLAFVVLGLVAFGVRRASRPGLWPFLVTATAASAPWYLRNWVLTGNPVYANSLGGLFPTNPVYAETMRAIAGYWHWDGSQYDQIKLLKNILILTLGVSTGGAIGLWLAGAKRWLPLGAALLIVVLWLWSVPQTGGGWNYSLRVLTPAVALGAVLSGWIGTSPKARWLAVGLISLLAVDAGRRAWLLPITPSAAPWPYSFQEWRDLRHDYTHISHHNLWDYLAARSRETITLVDSTAAHTLIAERGGRVALFFSPAAQSCFDEKLTFAEAVNRLRANRIRLLVLTVTDPISHTLIETHPFLHELCTRHPPLFSVENLAIYDLDLLGTPRPSAP